MEVFAEERAVRPFHTASMINRSINSVNRLRPSAHANADWAHLMDRAVDARTRERGAGKSRGGAATQASRRTRSP